MHEPDDHVKLVVKIVAVVVVVELDSVVVVVVEIVIVIEIAIEIVVEIVVVVVDELEQQRYVDEVDGVVVVDVVFVDDELDVTPLLVPVEVPIVDTP